MTKTVHVEKPFTLQLKFGDPPISVSAGIQQLPDEIADHWYAKVHFAHGGPGVPAYAEAARASADAQYEKAKEQFALYLALEATVLEAEAGVKGSGPTEPSCSRLPWPDTEAVENAYEAAKQAWADAQPKPEPEPNPEPKPRNHHKPAAGSRSRR